MTAYDPENRTYRKPYMNYSFLENFSGIERGVKKNGENLPVMTERRTIRRDVNS
jgi:hypothetical protein